MGLVSASVIWLGCPGEKVSIQNFHTWFFIPYSLPSTFIVLWKTVFCKLSLSQQNSLNWNANTLSSLSISDPLIVGNCNRWQWHILPPFASPTSNKTLCINPRRSVVSSLLAPLLCLLSYWTCFRISFLLTAVLSQNSCGALELWVAMQFLSVGPLLALAWLLVLR